MRAEACSKSEYVWGETQCPTLPWGVPAALSSSSVTCMGDRDALALEGVVVLEGCAVAGSRGGVRKAVTEPAADSSVMTTGEVGPPPSTPGNCPLDRASTSASRCSCSSRGRRQSGAEAARPGRLAADAARPSADSPEWGPVCAATSARVATEDEELGTSWLPTQLVAASRLLGSRPCTDVDVCCPLCSCPGCGMVPLRCVECTPFPPSSRASAEWDKGRDVGACTAVLRLAVGSAWPPPALCAGSCRSMPEASASAAPAARLPSGGDWQQRCETQNTLTNARPSRAPKHSARMKPGELVCWWGADWPPAAVCGGGMPACMGPRSC